MSREGEIDVRVAAPDEYGTVLFTATGSREHLNAMRQRRGRPKLAAREEDIYGQAGLPFIRPSSVTDPGKSKPRRPVRSRT